MIRTAFRLLRERDFQRFREATQLRFQPAVHWQGCWFYLLGIPATTRLQLLKHHYELDEISMLDRFDFSLPIVELGASSGILGCIANRRLQNSRNHVIVEANPRLSHVIRVNRSLNRAKFTFDIAAVAYGVQELQFPISDDPIASSVFNKFAKTVTVRAITLRQILDQHSFPKCNLMCDIEGQEIELVRNELPILRDRVSKLILEVHPKIVGEEATAQMLADLAQFFEIEHFHGQVYCFSNKT